MFVMSGCVCYMTVCSVGMCAGEHVHVHMYKECVRALPMKILTSCLCDGP